MQIMTDHMISTFQSAKLSGSYFILFFLSLVILYYHNRERSKGYLLYAVIGMLIYANPLVVWVIAKVFPVLSDYSGWFLIIPVLLFIPYGCVELMESIKDIRMRRIYMVLITLLFGISGSLFGLSGESISKWQDSRMTQEQAFVIERVSENSGAMVLADESIIPYFRTTGSDVTLLYGKDLWTQGMDLGIMDGYSEELMALYESMKNPKDTIKDITQTAEIYDCDTIVIKNYKYHPVSNGNYKLVDETDNYLIYEREKLEQ